MQLHKVLILAVPVMVIAACSAHKSASNGAESAISDIAAGTGTDMIGNQASADQQTRLQRQDLQRNNIVYFELDKYDILPEFIQMLDNHANFLSRNPSHKVTLEGHADERGTPEYNIALGERRANAAKMYMQGKGVAADQIAIVSYGKEKPAVLGHDEAAYAKNRRAVLVYY